MTGQCLSFSPPCRAFSSTVTFTVVTNDWQISFDHSEVILDHKIQLNVAYFFLYRDQFIDKILSLMVHWVNM